MAFAASCTHPDEESLLWERDVIRRDGRSTEQFLVSAYVGRSKKLEDLRELKPSTRTLHEGRYKATRKREFKVPWRKAGLLKSFR